MGPRIGILLFPDVEELDFAGPLEVFAMIRVGVDFGLMKEEEAPEIVTIGTQAGPIRGAKGLSVNPDTTIDEVDALDLLVIPGGFGTRPLQNDRKVLDWVAKIAQSAQWMTSVCTGSFIYLHAGLLDGKKVTTHWSQIEEMKAQGADKGLQVLENARYVRDGQLVTSAGVSAGIDMALWLTGQIYTETTARMVQKFMEYDPAPPYAAVV